MDPPPVVNICSITYLQVKKHAAAVDSHDLFPVISRGFDDRGNRNDARVGDRDVKPAILVNGDVDHPAGILRLRHVRRHDGDIICHVDKRIV